MPSLPLVPDHRKCNHCGKMLAFHTSVDAGISGSCRFESNEPPPRNHYAEACLIARGVSAMLPELAHLQSLYARLEAEEDQRERDADYIHDHEQYSGPEPYDERKDWL